MKTNSKSTFHLNTNSTMPTQDQRSSDPCGLWSI